MKEFWKIFDIILIKFCKISEEFCRHFRNVSIKKDQQKNKVKWLGWPVVGGVGGNRIFEVTVFLCCILL